MEIKTRWLIAALFTVPCLLMLSYIGEGDPIIWMWAVGIISWLAAMLLLFMDTDYESEYPEEKKK